LSKLTNLRRSQRYFLFRLGATLTEEDNGWELARYLGYGNGEVDIHDFLRTLFSIRDLIDEFKGDIISVDYKLYEDLHDSIEDRIALITVIADASGKEIARDKVKTLYTSYSALVDSMTALKESFQKASRIVSKGKSLTREAPSKSKRLAKPKKNTKNVQT
jgi:hypothetical protein